MEFREGSNPTSADVKVLVCPVRESPGFQASVCVRLHSPPPPIVRVPKTPIVPLHRGDETLVVLPVN